MPEDTIIEEVYKIINVLFYLSIIFLQLCL